MNKDTTPIDIKEVLAYLNSKQPPKKELYEKTSIYDPVHVRDLNQEKAIRADTPSRLFNWFDFLMVILFAVIFLVMCGYLAAQTMADVLN